MRRGFRSTLFRFTVLFFREPIRGLTPAARFSANRIHAMQHIDAIRETFPPAAKDVKLNVQSVLKADKLEQPQVWGIALASAYFVNEPKLTEAVLADAKADGVSDEVIDDARAAAAIMGMNTVYYRFRHLVSHSKYAELSPRVRMSRMAQPATDKATFELFSMACAVLAGCGMCINAHDEGLRKHGMTEDQVNDCVRIASVLQSVAVAMRL